MAILQSNGQRFPKENINMINHLRIDMKSRSPEKVSEREREKESLSFQRF